MTTKNDDLEYLQIVDTVRTGVNANRLGDFATLLLMNSKKNHIRDYEVIDDIKDILGEGNLELLREFVEIILIHGAARNTLLTYQAYKAHAKQRRKAAKELRIQQQNEAAIRKDARKRLNAEIDIANLPDLPEWVKELTGIGKRNE